MYDVVKKKRINHVHLIFQVMVLLLEKISFKISVQQLQMVGYNDLQSLIQIRLFSSANWMVLGNFPNGENWKNCFCILQKVEYSFLKLFV